MDGSGFIDGDEFRGLMRKLKLTYSDSRFKLLYRALDYGGDGRITEEELEEFLFPPANVTSVLRKVEGASSNPLPSPGIGAPGVSTVSKKFQLTSNQDVNHIIHEEDEDELSSDDDSAFGVTSGASSPGKVGLVSPSMGQSKRLDQPIKEELELQDVDDLEHDVDALESGHYLKQTVVSHDQPHHFHHLHSHQKK